MYSKVVGFFLHRIDSCCKYVSMCALSCLLFVIAVMLHWIPCVSSFCSSKNREHAERWDQNIIVIGLM